MTKQVTIYVHARTITRNGKRVEGWQAGYQRTGGGVTCVDKEAAIEHKREQANRLGCQVIEVIESDSLRAQKRKIP